MLPLVIVPPHLHWLTNREHGFVTDLNPLQTSLCSLVPRLRFLCAAGGASIVDCNPFLREHFFERIPYGLNLGPRTYSLSQEFMLPDDCPF